MSTSALMINSHHNTQAYPLKYPPPSLPPPPVPLHADGQEGNIQCIHDLLMGVLTAALAKRLYASVHGAGQDAKRSQRESLSHRPPPEGYNTVAEIACYRDMLVTLFNLAWEKKGMCPDVEMVAHYLHNKRRAPFPPWLMPTRPPNNSRTCCATLKRHMPTPRRPMRQLGTPSLD